MTHAQFSTLDLYWQSLAICNYLAFIASINRLGLSTELATIATAQLTNKAAAMSIEMLALEALEDTLPAPPDMALVVRNNPHFRKEIKLMRLEPTPVDSWDHKMGYTYWCRFQSGLAMADYFYHSRRQQWRIGIN